jgi:hypothetical protein
VIQQQSSAGFALLVFFLLSRNNAGPMKLGIIGPVPLSGSPKFQI